MLGLFFAVVIFLLFLLRPVKALGYPPLTWLLVSALFPLFPVLFFLLAILPNRKLDQDRALEMRLLVQKLKQKGINSKNDLAGIPSQTISDESTLE